MKIIKLVTPVAIAILLLAISCAEPVETPGMPTPTPTPPPALIGLIATDAYDGRVNLWWEPSTAEDFNHYSIYVSKSEIVDVSGIAPIHEIGDIIANTYQATGLEDGTKYYFAVTAIDKSGNENTLVDSVSATPTPMPRGTCRSRHICGCLSL